MDFSFIEKIGFETIYGVTMNLRGHPPFEFTAEVTSDKKINVVKLDDIMQHVQAKQKFVAECFNKFKVLYPTCRRGALHYNPAAWTDVALHTIKKSTCNQIKFPNGCCSLKDCAINNFYMIVLETLYCDKVLKLKICSKCNAIKYCSKECQREHWHVHKKVCNLVNAASENK